MKFEYGHITFGKATLWRQSRLRELKHQMQGYCPSIRLERVAFLPFGFAVEVVPNRFWPVYHGIKTKIAEWILMKVSELVWHFGLESKALD